MPTGYTCFIEDGSISKASDFIMLCARAFGALVCMRDEPLKAPIPKEFEPDNMYLDDLRAARENLAKCRGMSLSDAQERADAYHKERIERARKARSEAEELRRKYLLILRDVKAWIPPTPEHEGLKKFAINQIEMCIPDMSAYDREITRAKPSAQEWLDAEIESCTGSIAYYERMIQKENEGCASRNRWLSDLRESLEV